VDELIKQETVVVLLVPLVALPGLRFCEVVEVAELVPDFSVFEDYLFEIVEGDNNGVDLAQLAQSQEFDCRDPHSVARKVQKH